MQKIILILVSVVIAIIVFIWGASIYNSDFGDISKQNKFCTEEAKICPDGSAVGRAGPNCEFSPCPEINNILTQEEAKLIAQNECVKDGEVTSEGMYNENSKTWWFDANLNVAREGCNPACVVSEETRKAEINWRCIGLREPQKKEAELNIKVSAPIENTVIKSPLYIKGEAKNWYFEASFPIKLVDENGNILAQTVARAMGDWMVDDFVPFEAELIFDTPQSKKGEIIFEKDNPSGLPENDQSFRLPILFK
ncbi:MAG: hypothetical protein ACD_7C00154G0008 [uncultured bacterium]|nr:MAG: hypothetical protein ACD_7C00154G0008 [uncultured bacterium]HBR79359.1 hypothetical protein [Candidatus Moranbacteria bacterium]